MKEPETLQDTLHVLITMDDRTFIITHEQAQQLNVLINAGQTKSTSIGNYWIMLHQNSR